MEGKGKVERKGKVEGNLRGNLEGKVEENLEVEGNLQGNLDCEW